MTCNCTADPARATLGAPDPGKHVNYVLGMVLGVDDLNQDFAYLDNRVQSAVRELAGYGTDRGLAVRIEPTERGPQVRITAGVAYAPSGELICVSADQCCRLNDWLRSNARSLAERLGAADQTTLRLHVTLCYRECLTDKVPIPGEPCRSEDALMSPSRVQDSFTLELRPVPPRQTEEDAVREFVRWLRAVPVHDQSQPTSVEDLVEAIRAAAVPWLDLASPVDGASPPESPIEASPLDFMLGDPPADLAIPPGECAEYLRAAFRVWVTELRPVWIARFGGCHAGCTKPAVGDDCVLLATLDVPVLLQSPGLWEVSDIDPVGIDESRRPYLLHARMLQEWLLAMCACCGDTAAAAPPPLVPDLGGDVSGPIGDTTVNSIQGVDVIATGANEGQILTFDRGAWRPANPPPLKGDAAGPLDLTRVEGIRGVPVADIRPVGGEYLGFDGVSWTPMPLDVPPPVPVTGPFVTYPPEREKGFSILAAGRFGFMTEDTRVVVRPFAFDSGPVRSFNRLEVVGQSQGVRLPWFVSFTFDRFADFFESGVLIVKVTAGWLDEDPGRLGRAFPKATTKNAYQILFCKFPDQKSFQLVVPRSPGLETMADIGGGEMEIEVSGYPGR